MNRPPHSLPLNAVFGPTYQGEGPYTGRRCHFIRLGHCNLACTWCDTPYTWDKTRYDLDAENPWTPLADITAQLAHLNQGHLIVLSGGEPLMHQNRPAFAQLLKALTVQGLPVHAETNGTIPPNDTARQYLAHFSVSPKLTNNGADPQNRRLKPTALAAFADLARQGRACFKFVAATVHDLAEVDIVVEELDLPPHQVWVMPQGTTTEEVLATHRHLTPHLLDRPYNTTTRMHTLLWENEKDR